MRWIEEPRPEGKTRYPYRFALDSSSLAPIPRLVLQRRQVLKERRQMAYQTGEWCRLQYGTDDGKVALKLRNDFNQWRWTQDGTTFMFRYERDAFEFKMRWG